MDEAFAELQKKLRGLRGDGAIASQRKALIIVGDLFEDAIRERAPIKAESARGVLTRGEMQNCIKKKVSIPNDKGTIAGKPAKVTIGPRGHLEKLITADVEYGHGPNTGAHPFIRPAFDATKDAATAAYVGSMTEDIEKALK